VPRQSNMRAARASRRHRRVGCSSRAARRAFR
jgi:hypothetical protein